MPGIGDYIRAAMEKLEATRQASIDRVRKFSEEHGVYQQAQKIAPEVTRLKIAADMYAMPKVLHMEEELPESVQKRVSLSPITADPGSVDELDKAEKTPYQKALEHLKGVVAGTRKINIGGTNGEK